MKTTSSNFSTTGSYVHIKIIMRAYCLPISYDFYLSVKLANQPTSCHVIQHLNQSSNRPTDQINQLHMYIRSTCISSASPTRDWSLADQKGPTLSRHCCNKNTWLFERKYKQKLTNVNQKVYKSELSNQLYCWKRKIKLKNIICDTWLELKKMNRRTPGSLSLCCSSLGWGSQGRCSSLLLPFTHVCYRMFLQILQIVCYRLFLQRWIVDSDLLPVHFWRTWVPWRNSVRALQSASRITASWKFLS